MRKCRCKNPLGLDWIAILAVGVVAGVGATKAYEAWQQNQALPPGPAPAPVPAPPPGA